MNEHKGSNRNSLSQLGLMALLGAGALSSSMHGHANEGWSVVPYVGLSQLDDQTPTISNADDIADGGLGITVDSGFTAGLGIRYDYADSPWSSEIGWEYRSNDAVATASNGLALPDGNYASNTFYLNGRYALRNGRPLTPWVGGGLTWIQEVDLDSENAQEERSFEDSGSVGFQLMAGFNYKLSERLYLSTELRYSSITGIDLNEERGDGLISDIDYQPITFGLGIGIRL